MQNETYSVYHLSIVPSDFDAFNELIHTIVAATREEPDTTPAIRATLDGFGAEYFTPFAGFSR